MSIKTNELQQITAPQGSDSLLLDTAAAGTGRLTLAQAAQFFDQKLLQPGTQISASLSKKADAKSPQKYNFPLMDGFNGGIFCYKTQENVVVLYGYFSKAEGNIANWDIVTTIPEGFYPKDYFPKLIVDLGDGNGNFIGVVAIYYDNTSHVLRFENNVPENARVGSITSVCYISQ